MKTAFLFPGQGAQFVGMGKDLCDDFNIAAKIFEKANRIVGYDLKKICFEGPEDQLNKTTISQPAIFTVSAALLEILKTNESSKHIRPDVTAGLSMGEYTALYAAGVINFEQGLILVQKRGLAMQTAADATNGAMVSIIGLDEDKVKKLCDQARENDILEPVNFNCPGQIVLSGSIQACERAENLAPQYNAIKAVTLAVAGAFHTKMMNSAVDMLSEALEQCQISEPADIKTIANINALYYESSEEIKQGLKKQLTNPILWQNCMEKLLAEGFEDFYEIGPNRVLTGLMKRINRKTKVINISDAASVKKLLLS